MAIAARQLPRIIVLRAVLKYDYVRTLAAGKQWNAIQAGVKRSDNSGRVKQTVVSRDSGASGLRIGVAVAHRVKKKYPLLGLGVEPRISALLVPRLTNLATRADWM